MARGNGRMAIFLDDVDYRQFIFFLGEVVEEAGIDCLGYCLMPNHWHLILLPHQHNLLSEAIRRLNSLYGMWWNRRHQRVGHVFQGRFKDQIVDRDEYLLILSRYVMLNPVRAGLTKRAGDWPWSSYRATSGTEPCPSFLAKALILGMFGDADEIVLQDRFAQSVETFVDDPGAFERLRSLERIVGSRSFKRSIVARGSENAA